MSDLDRLKDSIQRLLKPFLRQLDYSALYGATVASQNADGTLELKSATPKLPHLSSVPIRYGIPGISVKVNPGAMVLVGWENADPSQVYCLVISSAAGIASISIMGGKQPIARMGDAVSVIFPPSIPFVGTIAGLPAVGVITIPPVPVPGLIITGRKDVTA